MVGTSQGRSSLLSIDTLAVSISHLKTPVGGKKGVGFPPILSLLCCGTDTMTF
jgi:hypothetical protein